MDEPSGRRLCFALLVATFLALQAGPVIAAQGEPAGGSSQRTPVRPGDRLYEAWQYPTLYINLSGRPHGVRASRLRYLVHKSARRWGVRLGGLTRTPPRRGDGINVIGFSRIPSAANADTLDTSTFVGGVRDRREVDVRLNPHRRWQQGPSLPAYSEWDLETVILHELGHVAGARHTPTCLNSPMAPGLARGEWWRAAWNWYRQGCRNPADSHRR
jgi:hypothetical protein